MSGTTAYGILAGDSSASRRGLGIQIDNWINVTGNEYSTALLYIDNIREVTLNHCHSSAASNILDFSGYSSCILNFNYCNMAGLDLKNAPPYTVINFVGCPLFDDRISTYPINDAVSLNFFGNSLTFDINRSFSSIKTIHKSSEYTLKPWETCILADTNEGTFKITLPNERGVKDEYYFFKNTGSNTLQIAGNIYTIQGSSWFSLSSSSSVILKLDHKNFK
jgi:hypothetical protein